MNQTVTNMPAASAVLSLLTFFGPCKESQSPVGAKPDGLILIFAYFFRKTSHSYLRGPVIAKQILIANKHPHKLKNYTSVKLDKHTTSWDTYTPQIYY
jgi:hypothetical protein